ncbi:MAG: DciA family protein [Candidatus Aceula lacicola]|nr:DciA family protein [Candidatus Aceula lacicola]
MEEIKNIIPDVVKMLSRKETSEETKIQRVWDSLLEGKIKKHAKIFGIKEGKMMVCVDSPAWMFHLNLKKNKLLKEIKEEIPELIEICFKIGKVK